MRFSKIAGIFLSISFFVAALLFVFNFQSIYDWYRLRDYTPSKSIKQLATASGMNDNGRKLFYVYHPVLTANKDEFRANCANHEVSIVLGCYVSKQGIYIYKVDDKRLDGVEEVTAAHEMLHVGYERLSNDERARIDALTAQAFTNTKNRRLKQTVEQYRKNDASVVPNELHSILGTEVADLPAELEEHYSQYFKNRAKVVKLAEKYEEAFNARERQIDVYDARLEALNTEIESARAQIDGLANDLQLQRQQLDNYLDAGNTAAYNAGIPGYNADVNYYNSLIDQAQARIAEFNEVVKKRNAITVEERELYDALDSRSSPQTI